jgi:hypothetical protein
MASGDSEFLKVAVKGAAQFEGEFTIGSKLGRPGHLFVEPQKDLLLVELVGLATKNKLLASLPLPGVWRGGIKPQRAHITDGHIRFGVKPCAQFARQTFFASRFTLKKSDRDLPSRDLLAAAENTHYNADYRIGSTRVLTNQRGYPGEGCRGFNPALVVEV